MKIEMKQYTAKKCARGDEKVEVIYLVKNMYGEPVGKVTIRDRFMGFEAIGDETFCMNEEIHRAMIEKVFLGPVCDGDGGKKKVKTGRKRKVPSSLKTLGRTLLLRYMYPDKVAFMKIKQRK